MVAILVGSLATLVTAPLLAWVVVYWSVKKFTGKRKKSFLFATDVTTFFLISSVLAMMDTIWKHTFLWPILILLLSIVISITLVYWKQDKEVGFLGIVKTAWRFNFLLFSFGYVFLCLYGLVDRVLEI